MHLMAITYNRRISRADGPRERKYRPSVEPVTP